MSLDKIGGIFCLCRLKEFFVGNKCRHTVFLQSNSLIFFSPQGKKNWEENEQTIETSDSYEDI